MGTRIVPSSLRLAAPLNPVNDRFTGAFIQTMLRTRLKTTLKLTSTTFSESLCSVRAPGPQASRARASQVDWITMSVLDAYSASCC